MKNFQRIPRWAGGSGAVALPQPPGEIPADPRLRADPGDAAGVENGPGRAVHVSLVQQHDLARAPAGADVVGADGVSERGEEQTADVTPRGEGAGLFLGARVAGQPGQEMGGKEVAELAEAGEFGTGWRGRGCFSSLPCRRKTRPRQLNFSSRHGMAVLQNHGSNSWTGHRNGDKARRGPQIIPLSPFPLFFRVLKSPPPPESFRNARQFPTPGSTAETRRSAELASSVFSASLRVSAVPSDVPFGLRPAALRSFASTHLSFPITAACP